MATDAEILERAKVREESTSLSSERSQSAPEGGRWPTCVPPAICPHYNCWRGPFGKRQSGCSFRVAGS